MSAAPRRSRSCSSPPLAGCAQRRSRPSSDFKGDEKAVADDRSRTSSPTPRSRKPGAICSDVLSASWPTSSRRPAATTATPRWTKIDRRRRRLRPRGHRRHDQRHHGDRHRQDPQGRQEERGDDVLARARGRRLAPEQLRRQLAQRAPVLALVVRAVVARADRLPPVGVLAVPGDRAGRARRRSASAAPSRARGPSRTTSE